MAESSSSLVESSEEHGTAGRRVLVGGKSEGDGSSQDFQQQQQCAVERSNLLNLTKLVVKALVEASMRGGQAASDSNPAVRHLFVVLEQVMSHRLRGGISG